MAHPTLTAMTTTTTMTPVISTSNLPISPTLSTSYDPSQSSLSSASEGRDESTMDVFFANMGMIEGDEFDSSAFRAVYSAFLSPEQKQTYLAALEVAERDTGKKVSYKLVVGADDFDDEEQKILKDAADIMMSSPKLKTLSKRYTKLADKELYDINDEDSELDFTDEKKKLEKAYDRLPDAAKKEVRTRAEYYAPHPTLAVVSKKDMDKWNEKRDILATKGKAHVMQMLAQNSNPVACKDIETMMCVIGLSITTTDAPFGLTEGYFCNAYKNMSSKEAKQAYAVIVGYAIGRLDDGEKYLTGKLTVDDKRIVPDISLLGKKLAELALHYGIGLPLTFGVFFSKEDLGDKHSEGGGSDPGYAPPVENEGGPAVGSRAAMLSKWKKKLNQHQ